MKNIEQLATKEQKIQYLNELIENSRGNCSNTLAEMMKIRVQDFVPVLSSSLQKSLELLFNMLSIEECFEFLLNDKDSLDKCESEQTKFLCKLLHTVCQMNVPEKYRKLALVFNHHPTTEHMLVMHRLFALHCSQSTEEKEYPEMVPTFIRTAAFILEKYLKTKNEPAKGDEDHIANDKVIINKAQSWLSENIFTFFNRLPAPKQSSIRKIVIIALGDLMGAIVQTSRENSLSKQILDNLLKSCLMKYFFKNFSFDEAKNLFEGNLISCNFSNPEKKIEIPEKYILESDKVQMNTTAMGLLTLEFIRSPSLAILSSQRLIQILLPITSQILSRPYEVKVGLIEALEKILEANAPINIQTGFQLKYPIFKFLFELKYHENSRYAKIKQFFHFKDSQVLLNGLFVLKQMNMETINADRDRFIIHCFEEYKIEANQRMIVLLKSFKFEECNAICQETMLNVMQNLVQRYEKPAKRLLGKWNEKNNHLSAQNKEKLTKLIG